MLGSIFEHCWEHVLIFAVMIEAAVQYARLRHALKCTGKDQGKESFKMFPWPVSLSEVWAESRRREAPPKILVYIYTSVSPCISMHGAMQSRARCNRVEAGQVSFL